nr:MAG TPA: hypothetical protein [Caudoviricetes sp.]
MCSLPFHFYYNRTYSYCQYSIRCRLLKTQRPFFIILFALHG